SRAAASLQPSLRRAALLQVFQHLHARANGGVEQADPLRRLALLTLDGVLHRLDSPHVLDAVLERLRVQVVELPRLHLGLDPPEALALEKVELRRILDSKAGPLHPEEELAAELTVETDLLDLKAPLPHPDEPLDNLFVLGDRAVGHREPAIILPPEERDAVLVRLD